MTPADQNLHYWLCHRCQWPWKLFILIKKCNGVLLLLHQEDMIAINNPRILLHTTRYPVRNTYSLNVHEYSCNDCYSSKQFITKPYDTFNHLTDPRGCVELISTYGVFLSFFLLQEIFCKISSSILFFLNYVVHGNNVRLSA